MTPKKMKRVLKQFARWLAGIWLEDWWKDTFF